MAQIVLIVPDGVVQRVIDAVALKFNFGINAQVNETKPQFLKRILGQTLKQWVKDAEGSVPYVTARAAQATAEQDIEANISIT